MRITIEHDDGRTEVRENVACFGIFSESDITGFINSYNDYHDEKIEGDDVDLATDRILDLLTPDYYSLSEWMDYELEDFMEDKEES